MAKTYDLKETKNPYLFRVVDRNGDWDHYYLKLPGMDSGVYLRSVTGILDRGYTKGKFLMNWALEQTKESRDQILKSAGGKGDRVHRSIDIMLNGEPKLDRETGIFNRYTGDYEKLTNDEWDCLLSFSKFWSDHQPIVLANEVPIFSMEKGYAGTTDIFWILSRECENKKCACHSVINQVGIGDFKTSKGIYPSYWAQEAAYADADNVAEFLPKDSKIKYLSVLRLGTSHANGGYEFKVEFDKEKDHSLVRFHAAKAIDDYDYKQFDPGDIEEIPDSIEIHVSKYVEPIVVEKPKRKSKKKSS